MSSCTCQPACTSSSKNDGSLRNTFSHLYSYILRDEKKLMGVRACACVRTCVCVIVCVREREVDGVLRV